MDLQIERLSLKSEGEEGSLHCAARRAKKRRGRRNRATPVPSGLRASGMNLAEMGSSAREPYKHKNSEIDQASRDDPRHMEVLARSAGSV